MEFIEGSSGIYGPIRVLFDTAIYKRALQICWDISSYKCQIALVTELLRLQQRGRLPAEVTAEDMAVLLVEEGKSSLRVWRWELELENFGEDEAKPLLRLVWEVNTSMKMSDAVFEARRLLSSPRTIPPLFQHPDVISQARVYARALTEQQREAPTYKLLTPREVVLEVVPKVLHGFWLPPPNTCFSMPSLRLSNMAVGVTKAVQDRVSAALPSMLRQVSFTRSIRDDLILSIQGKVRQYYREDALLERLKCFAAEVLNAISDAAAREIRLLFEPLKTSLSEPAPQPAPSPEPHSAVVSPLPLNGGTGLNGTQLEDMVDNAQAESSPAEGQSEDPGLEEDTEPIKEPDSAVTTLPPAPLITSAEPPAIAASQSSSSLDEATWFRSCFCCCCFLPEEAD